ncbi:MAG: DeoR/GlpR transcriptional regulator [Oscillospiraceae bacterium]|nr:DeoR/GlpR transcriptional regulator [Oscillospiraceae bacterium]
MSQKLRQDAILDILQKQNYVSVKYLVDTLHYSNATINRDLNVLKQRNLINRSYGGVELISKSKLPALPFRYHFMKKEKRQICKIAAEQVCDGDTIFIDATTTTQFMSQYLIERKNLTVITNNLSLAGFLSEQGVDVICLGGRVVETPSMLYSDETAEFASRYLANKMFFSTSSFSPDGKIKNNGYIPLIYAMMKNSDKIYYLADHEKSQINAPKVVCDFGRVDVVISDYDFSDETKATFPNTEFFLA